MSRMVFCRKLKKELPGLARAPFPGAKGEDHLAKHLPASLG